MISLLRMGRARLINECAEWAMPSLRAKLLNAASRVEVIGLFCWTDTARNWYVGLRVRAEPGRPWVNVRATESRGGVARSVVVYSTPHGFDWRAWNEELFDVADRPACYRRLREKVKRCASARSSE